MELFGMSNEDPDDTEARLRELTERVEALQSELEQRRRRPPLLPPPPTTEELRRFSSEIAIPGLIFLLETNVRALKLLRKTLAVSEEGRRASERADAVRAEANKVGTAALGRLEDALVEVQSALEGEPPDSEARDILEEARQLREDIQSQLTESNSRQPEGGAEGPEVDVEAELQSIRDQVDDEDDV